MTGQQDSAVKLMRRWNLARDDLDAAADALDVDRLSPKEWAEDLGPP
ncbi:hypothetical protein ACFV1N_42105 [Streptosporangium canum]